MTGPPAVRPDIQELPGLVSGGMKAGKVTVVNPPWNGSGRIKRKTADFYVNEGRAVWVGAGSPEPLLWMIESHPKNQAARLRAAAGYDATEWAGRRITPEELLHIGVVCPAKAITENLTVRVGVPARRHFAGRSGPATGSSGRPTPERRVAPMTWNPPPA